MQRNSAYSKGQLLDCAAVQIPEIAQLDEPVFLFCQQDNVNQLVASAIHDFSPTNGKPFFSIECRTNEISLDSFTSLQSVKRDLDEVLHMVGSGMGEWLKGGSVLLNNFSDLPQSGQKALMGKITSSLECRVFVNMFKSRSKLNPDEQPPVEGPTRNVVTPPLRNQAKNIQFFSNYFLVKANLEWSRNITGIDAATLRRLTDYSWPGDLNELKDVIFQSVLIAKDGEELSEATLPVLLKEFRNDANSLRKAIITAEHRLIQQALQQARNNKKKAAAILNISRKTLYSKLRMFEEFAA